MTKISKINGIPILDTKISGFTFNGINEFTISDSENNTYSTTINSLSADTISATTLFGDGSNLTVADMPSFSVKAKPTTGTGNPSNLTITTDGVLGRVGSGDIVSMTPTQSTARLNIFTPTLKGLTPLSSGGTNNYLRADGGWASPTPTINEASAINTITTVSTTFILSTPMSITPPSGNYMVWFSTSISNDDRIGQTELSIYAGDTEVSHTRRKMTNEANAFIDHIQSITTNGTVTVNGAETIEIRWRQLNGGTASMYERTLNIMKIT